MNIEEMIIAQKELSKKLKFLELFKSEDDYALEFAEWISKQEYNLDFWVRHNQTKNLLKKFKEEKGLWL